MKTHQKSVLLKSVVLISGIALFSVVSHAAFSLDLVAKVAVTSFEAMTQALPNKVAFDSGKNGWSINGLDGKERILLSKNFSGAPDIQVEFDAAPFIKAGLDTAKLPAGQYKYDQATGKITMPYDYGKVKFGADAAQSVMGAFKQIVKTKRSMVGYHEKLDHYGLTLGDGNMFEWAKDISTNDKDLVFVLNPKPLIDAGVKPEKITEWVFAKVPVKDPNGKPIEVEKFLKPFNLK